MLFILYNSFGFDFEVLNSLRIFRKKISIDMCYFFECIFDTFLFECKCCKKNFANSSYMLHLFQ